VQARRRENGVYYVRVDGRRVSLHTRNARTAQAKVDELERRAADPAYARAHGVTLDAACAAFVRDAPVAGNRAKPPALPTIDMWRLHCGHFVRVIGPSTPLAAVDAAAVEAYIAKRRSEPVNGKAPGRPRVGASTVAKELSTLRKVLAAAARRGEYHHRLDAVFPERAPTAGAPGTRSLQWSAVPAFLAAFDRWDRAAACAFVLGLGADKACLATARADDFDWRRGVVLVRGTKTAKRFAEVPIVEPFTELVARAWRFLRGHGTFGPWRNSTRDIALACRRAGLPRVTLRDLRRTFGETLRSAGAPAGLIGEMLRHADGRMAERVYAKIGAEALRTLVVRATVLPTLPEIDLPPADDTNSAQAGDEHPLNSAKNAVRQ
jgi:integrase